MVVEQDNTKVQVMSPNRWKEKHTRLHPEPILVNKQVKSNNS